MTGDLTIQKNNTKATLGVDLVDLEGFVNLRGDSPPDYREWMFKGFYDELSLEFWENGVYIKDWFWCLPPNLTVFGAHVAPFGLEFDLGKLGAAEAETWGWRSLFLANNLTADPTLRTGRIWFRQDLGLIRYSPDGVVARNIPYGSINVDSHVSRHASGGADPLTDAILDGIVGFDLGAHVSRHGSGGADPLTDAMLDTIVGFDLGAHASRHHSGGADPLDLPSIAGVITDAQHGTKTTIPEAHHGDYGHYGKLAYGTLANRPSAGVAGRWYYAIDQDLLYRDDGSAWNVMPLSAFLFSRKRLLYSFFESIDGFTQILTGSASISAQIMDLNLQTGTSSSYVGIQSPARWMGTNVDCEIAFNVGRFESTVDSLVCYLHACRDVGSLTNYQFGFKVVDQNLYATSTRSLEETTLLESSLPQYWAKNLIARLIRLPTPKVEFWTADVGGDFSLVATHTAEVPYDWWLYAPVIWLHNLVASNKWLRMVSITAIM